MSPGEYQELADFFVDRLGQYHRETRAFVEVSVESLRSEIRLVADGVLTNGRRIEENGRRIEENGRRIEENGNRIEENGNRIDENGRRIDALTQRVENLEVAVSARFADHEERLSALE